MKRNVLANYLGQSWSILMGIAFIPLIIKYVGVEAYGLVGVFAMLQAWFSFLDLGMTPTISREMARYTSGAHTSQSIRDLLRSLELTSSVIAVLIAIFIFLSSDWLAAHWLHSDKLTVSEVSHSISIMAFVVSLRFVEGVYRGALVGFQKQVQLNIISAVQATLRWGGVVGVLVWVEPTITAFFIWQGLVSIVTIFIFSVLLYNYLPNKSQSGAFSWVQLRSVWSFAKGMMAQTFLTLMLTQVDKVILSKLLSLEMFGYYTVAATLAGALINVIAPITLAYYPRFTELVTKGEKNLLVTMYHQSAQLVSIFIASAVFVLIFYGETIVFLWGGDALLANNVAPLLALLAFGAMLNGLMHIPHMLTLAHGSPEIFVRIDSVAIVILIPAIILITPLYGAIGAAWIGIALNLGYVLIASRFVYPKHMEAEIGYWYKNDIILPIVGALIMAILWGLFKPSFSSKIIEAAWILASFLFALITSTLFASNIRKVSFDFIRKLLQR
jgi:O-antigen/teichoic acid export membrane protein